MQKSKRKYILILCAISMFIIGKPALTYGSTIVPKTIRVGLRSAYAGKSSIAIKNTQLQVGYERQDRFQSEETLSSSTGFLLKANAGNYYADKNTFSTYTEANKLLSNYKSQGTSGLVAYKGPGNWQVYLVKNLGQMSPVSNTGSEIIVYDGAGNPMIFCDGAKTGFAGINQGYSFNLTSLANGSYRGWFEFVRRGSTITAVNIVDHEEYLYGVIAAEMPASWHIEALKAQAVAARSMSIYQSRKYLNDGYNVCDTIYTQVYKGFSGEYESTNRAVDETRGVVVTHNGKIAETLFFSTSGGYTEDPQYVWGNQVAYLKAVPDPYETDPEMKPWTRTITLAEIDKCLRNQKVNIGPAKGLRINSYTPAGRVNELEIIGTSGTHKLTRENIRTFFSATNGGSLRSRMFTIGKQTQAPIINTSPIEDIVVYRGERPSYVISASGKIRPVGHTLVVQGIGGQAIYGSSQGGNQGNNQGSQTQYGDIVISGRGYGHGVGMSQSGAKGMAQAGYSYDEIIKYYYQGVELQK